MLRGSAVSEGDLSLIAELAALRYVRGRHTGKHLAEAFMKVITDLGVLHRVRTHQIYMGSLLTAVMSKLGFITVDNAANNNTMMDHLEDLLREKGVPFDRTGNRIR